MGPGSSPVVPARDPVCGERSRLGLRRSRFAVIALAYRRDAAGYAALRPAEAVALRAADLVLPDAGWGRIDLAASSPCAGTECIDDGASRQERGLKHRPPGETRSIPIPPALVELPRNHLKRYGTGPGGRVFRTARGGPLNDTGYGEVWERARPIALTPAQQTTPLARRPYDLRHAAVSLWLRARQLRVRARSGIGVCLHVKGVTGGDLSVGRDVLEDGSDPVLPIPMIPIARSGVFDRGGSEAA